MTPPPVLPLAPLAITGLGAVTAAGAGVHLLWDAILAARPLATPVSRYPTEGFTTRHAALVPAEVWATCAHRWPTHDRAVQLALAALEEAMRGVTLHGTVGLFVGTSLGAVPAWEPWHEGLVTGSHRPLPEGLASTHGDTALALGRSLGMKGPVVTVSTACTSSAGALIQAADAIHLGEIDAALVVGVDVLGPFVHAGFCRLGALSPDDLPPAPFATDRAGMWLGEGAAAVVLQREGVASGRYLGGGTAADGVHMTAPDRTGGGLQRAARRALEESAVHAAEVAWISAHATATRFNDAMEDRALAGLYPSGAAPRVHGAKPVLGHCLGASALLEVILGACVLTHGVRPPTFQPGPLDPALTAVTLDDRVQPLQGRVIVSVNTALAGHNTAVVLGAP